MKALAEFPRWTRRCKACTAEYKRAWRAANAEHVRAYEADYRERFEDKDARRARDRLYAEKRRRAAGIPQRRAAGGWGDAW